MITIGDIVRLDAAGHVPHGKKHRVIAFWTDDFLGPLVELRCIDDPSISDISWRPDQIKLVARAQPVEQLPLFGSAV